MSSDLPIIIIGCPRSGTTLLRRLIGAHPRLDCPGESFLLRAAVRFLRGERVAEGIDYGPLGGLLPLGFEPEEVKAHVSWWAGEADINCPLTAVQRYVDRLPTADLHVWEGAGHLRQYLRANQFLPDLIRRAFGD